MSPQRWSRPSEQYLMDFLMVGGGIKSAKNSQLPDQGRSRRIGGRNVVGANRRFKKIHRNGQIHPKINSNWGVL